MERDRQTGVAAEPNVTPMIDVLLVLLIVFMLVAPERRDRIDAQLPDRTAGGGAAAIVLEVGPAGRLAINRERVSEARLGTRLRAIYAGRPERAIVVRGARTARYESVIAAMDSARGAGVRVIALDLPRPD